MKERAIQTLGYFPVGDGVFPHQKLLLQGLMDSVEVLISLIIQIKCIFSCVLIIGFKNFVIGSLLIYFMCLCVYVIITLMQCPQRLQVGTGSPDTIITDGH